MYGAISLTTGGPFAFFPINELVLFGVVSYFAFFNFKKAPSGYLLFLLISVLGLIQNQLFLGIFFSNLQITNFLNSDSIHFLPGFTSILILLEISRFFFLTKSKIYFFPIIALIFCFGAYFNIHSFQSFAILLFFIILIFYFRKEKQNNHKYHKSLYYIWFLFLFLKLSTLFSMYLYDFDLGF